MYILHYCAGYFFSPSARRNTLCALHTVQAPYAYGLGPCALRFLLSSLRFARVLALALAIGKAWAGSYCLRLGMVITRTNFRFALVRLWLNSP